MHWHKRYLQQAAWTRDLRSYLFEQAGFGFAQRVLEVGCGTGAVLQDLMLPQHRTAAAGGDFTPHIHGVDVDRDALLECQAHAPRACLAAADALALPYPDGSFDITFCHFFLMWIKQPLHAVYEMKRVTHGHGSVLALAEPDYTSRVDEPQSLAELGTLQNRSLIEQGADIGLGARLPDLFDRSGIRVMEAGIVQPRPPQGLTAAEAKDEWDVLQSDLARIVPSPNIRKMQRLDAEARVRRQRLVHVPTYFAWGQV